MSLSHTNIHNLGELFISNLSQILSYFFLKLYDIKRGEPDQALTFYATCILSIAMWNLSCIPVNAWVFFKNGLLQILLQREIFPARGGDILPWHIAWIIHSKIYTIGIY